MKRCLLLGIFVISLGALKAETRFVIQSSHHGPVISLNWQKTQELLVSWGKDYRLKIWQNQQKKLIYDIYLPELYANLLAIHPELSQLAYLAQQENGYELRVYDWLKDKQLFKHRLTDRPLTLTYSPQGNWLALSVENWRSLLLLDSQTGAEKYIMPAFGLVTFVGFSPRESSLFAYQPSGKITYWDLKPTPVLKAELKTISALNPILLSQDRCFLLAQKSNSLYLIDAVKGVQMTSLSYQMNFLVGSSAYSQTFICLMKNPEKGFSLEFFSLQNGSIKKVKELRLDSFEGNVSALYYMDGLCFLGLSDGSIFRLKNDVLEPILKNKSSKVRQMALHNGSLLALLSEEIVVLKKLFNSLTAMDQSSEICLELHRLKISPQTSFRIDPSPQGGFFLWEEKRSSGLIYRLDFKDSLILEKLPVLEPGLNSLFSSPYGLLIINQNNLLRLLDEKTFKIQAEISVPNIKEALAISGSKIILSQEPNSILNSPLLYWQTQTSKPIPLPEDYRTVEALAFNPKASLLAYIALTEKDRAYIRSLKIRHLADLKFSCELISQSKPTGKPFLISDSSNGHFYFTLGEGKVSCYDGNKISQFQPAPTPLLSLGLSANFIYGLGDDSTLIIWDKDKGEILYQFYIFPNYAWFILSMNNTVFFCGDLADYVSFAEGLKIFELSFVSREQDWP